MLQQILVEIGQAARRPGRRQGLAVGADRRREVGGLDQRQGFALDDLPTGRNQQLGHRPREGGQHAGRLVVVEIDDPRRVDGVAERRRLDGVEPDVAPLRRGQRRFAPRCGRAGRLLRPGTAGECESGRDRDRQDGRAAAERKIICHGRSQKGSGDATSRRRAPGTGPPCRRTGWPRPGRG